MLVPLCLSFPCRYIDLCGILLLCEALPISLFDPLRYLGALAANNIIQNVSRCHYSSSAVSFPQLQSRLALLSSSADSTRTSQILKVDVSACSPIASYLSSECTFVSEFEFR